MERFLLICLLLLSFVCVKGQSLEVDTVVSVEKKQRSLIH